MKELNIVITNPTGLHARPAKVFVKLAKKFKSDIWVRHGEKKAKAKSLVSMLTLGIKCGSEINIAVEGLDEVEALEALHKAIDDGLGENHQTSSDQPKGPVHAAEEIVTTATEVSNDNVIRGLAAAPGCVVGPVWQFSRTSIEINEPSAGVEIETSRLQDSLKQAYKQLTDLRDQMSLHSTEEAEIFNVHLELLEDDGILEEVMVKINSGQSAASAWQSTINDQAKIMAELDDPLLAARSADLRDVGQRILRLLLGIKEEAMPVHDQPVVICADDLTPSETAALDQGMVLGFCTSGGGPTAHSAIIARAMGIPAIVSAGGKIREIANRTLVVLDGSQGLLTIEPSAAEIAQAQDAAKRYQEQRQVILAAAGAPAVTRDGYRFEVAANIGGLADAAKVISSGAEGVGLFRTEFLFLDQQNAPTEDEQFEVYRQAVEDMQGAPIIFRTLDIGGDKPLPYIEVPHEENPFLGERGIRLCLNRPELLLPQLQALFRAAEYAPIRIMFPMVSDLSDWHGIQAIIDSLLTKYKKSQIEFGVMIEVPSAALTASALAQHVDFFSIGTNDLTQYTLAMDRMHGSLGHRLDGLHPAVLHLIDTTVRAAKKYGKWVGVCGELGSDTQAIPILIGLGVAELSVSIPAVAEVKSQVRNLNLHSCQSLSERALQCALPEEVRALKLSS
jgi:phosphocarrier protein FPr